MTTTLWKSEISLLLCSLWKRSSNSLGLGIIKGATLVTDGFPNAIYSAPDNLYNVCGLAPNYLQDCIFSMEFAQLTQAVQEKLQMALCFKDVVVGRLPSTAFGMVSSGLLIWLPPGNISKMISFGWHLVLDSILVWS